MTDYFKLATGLARVEAAVTLAKVKPCRCPLYSFPHRRSDRCDDAEMEALDAQTEMQTKADWGREELLCFDAAEARAINRSL